MDKTDMDNSNGKLASKRGFVSAKTLKVVFLTGTVISVLFLILPQSIFRMPNNVLFKKYNYKHDFTNFTIKTEGCTIPSMRIFDDNIQKYIEYPKDIPSCLNSSQVILENNKTHIWIRKELLQIKEIERVISCCYRSFYRPPSIDDIDGNVDNRVKYNECVVFTNNIKVKDEFVKVNCSIGIIHVEEYFLFAPLKQFKSHNGHKEILKNESSFNVLILGIDSVSRLNVFRTMPNTIKYLRERGAIDLNGYNKVGDNTFPNLMPMLLGISHEELKTLCLPHKNAKFDNCPFIWEWYKQAGYYTALAEDSSWLGTFNYLRAGFSNTPTDYYPHTFINEAESYAFKQNGFNTSKICLNKKYFYQVLLDYIEDVTATLKEKRLFGFFWEITMSHDDLNYPMAMDGDYLKFFKSLESSGYLNDTIVFIISDHGIRWGDIRYTKQGRLEERLPFVFILTPTTFRENYEIAYKNLQLNSKHLTTPYDIHATLFDLLNLKRLNNDVLLDRSNRVYYKNKSISLFLPIPSNRTCEYAGISDHWCTCHKSVTLPTKDKKILSGAVYLVKYLNALLIDYSYCQELQLAEVVDAAEMFAGKAEDDEIESWREFLLVIRTLPGSGVFEATLREDQLGWNLVGTVSRLNLYGNQSFCVGDNLLKLYCFCENNETVT